MYHFSSICCDLTISSVLDFAGTSSTLAWVGGPYDFYVIEGSVIGYQFGQIEAEHTTSSTNVISYSRATDPHDIVDLYFATGAKEKY